MIASEFAENHWVEEPLSTVVPEQAHDFGDDQGPVPAHQHPNGGGWVANSAFVAETAFVGVEAEVFGSAEVVDQATVTETAWVCGEARIAGRGHVGGDAVVGGNARVHDDAQVVDNAYVSGDVVLEGHQRVGGDEQIVDAGATAGTYQWEAPSLSDEAVQWEEQQGPVDSAAGRIRWGWPGARVLSNQVLRRLQDWELVLVLCIFPLGSALEGVIILIQRVQTHVPVTSPDLPVLRGAWLVVALSVIAQITVLAAAGMVCYLLSRSGEGVRAINLGRKRLRMDLALLLPVFVVVFWIPQTFGSHLLSWLHIRGFYILPTPVPLPLAALTIAQVVFGITAGIVEEIIVLGYLVRRLEQRGLSAPAVVFIAVAVRISYHLYYGWNVVPIALWALVSVLVYLRVRRLLPFILCHIAWDAAIPFRAFYSSAYHAMWLIAVISTLVFAIFWIRWTPVARDMDLGPKYR